MDKEIKSNQEESEFNIQNHKDSNTFEIVKELNSFKELIKDHLDRQIELNRFKDETINRLQKSISEHEKGLIAKIKEPLIWNLIFFKDSFEKFKNKAESGEFVLVGGFDTEIEMLDDELFEILYSNGIEKIITESNFYDRTKQTVIRKEKTYIKDEDNKVIKVLKSGYQLDGRIIRKEEVIINYYMED